MKNDQITYVSSSAVSSSAVPHLPSALAFQTTGLTFQGQGTHQDRCPPQPDLQMLSDK